MKRSSVLMLLSLIFISIACNGVRKSSTEDSSEAHDIQATEEGKCKAITPEVSGEQHGNYYVEWSLKESKVAADTVRISEDDELIVMNNELNLHVRYKGEAIFHREISSDDFKGIDRAEQYILAEPRSVHSDNVVKQK